MNLFVDSTNCTTRMCELGGYYNTDKSPLALNSACCSHRKGYTAVYSLIFSRFVDEPINIAEIGIEAGASLLLWSDYFRNANIYAFELSCEKIQRCRDMNLQRVSFIKTDVSNKEVFQSSFESTNVLFDIIIDDSSHLIEHQNVIINNSARFLKKGGILIIEDIDRTTELSSFIINPEEWHYFTFITCHHDNRQCFDNDKILYLVRR